MHTYTKEKYFSFIIKKFLTQGKKNSYTKEKIIFFCNKKISYTREEKMHIQKKK